MTRALVLGITSNLDFSAANLLVGIKQHLSVSIDAVYIFNNGIEEKVKKSFCNIGFEVHFIEYSESYVWDRMKAHASELDYVKNNLSDVINRYSHFYFAKFETADLLSRYDEVFWMDTDMLVLADFSAIFTNNSDIAWVKSVRSFKKNLTGFDVAFSEAFNVSSSVVNKATQPNGGLIVLKKSMLTHHQITSSDLYKTFLRLMSIENKYYFDEMTFAVLALEKKLIITLLDRKFNMIVAHRDKFPKAAIYHSVGKHKFWNTARLAHDFPEWIENENRVKKLGIDRTLNTNNSSAEHVVTNDKYDITHYSPLKIGVLTLPLNKNFGGNLQAYALTTALKNMGHQPVLLNRKHSVKNEQTSDSPSNTSLFTDNIGINAPLNNRFINVNIEHITRAYSTSNELASQLASYELDAVVVGSDQVWRPKYAKSILPDFFLKFIPEENRNIKRISYAASFGADQWEYDAPQAQMASKLLAQFDAVSVREDTAAMMCEQHFSVKAEHVLDPTMLLTADHYINTFSLDAKRPDEQRLLNYVLDIDKDKASVIEHLSVQLGLSAYSANGEPFKFTSALKANGGDQSVEGWLAAFYKSAFVVTDSFHGVVFSILFNKAFIAYGNPARGMARFTSLLTMFGLENRLVRHSADIDLATMLQPIDWVTVNEKLVRLREQSKQFLTSALFGERGDLVVKQAAIVKEPLSDIQKFRRVIRRLGNLFASHSQFINTDFVNKKQAKLNFTVDEYNIYFEVSPIDSDSFFSCGVKPVLNNVKSLQGANSLFSDLEYKSFELSSFNVSAIYKYIKNVVSSLPRSKEEINNSKINKVPITVYDSTTKDVAVRKFVNSKDGFTIVDVVESNMCIGCGVCSVATNNAITISVSDEGLFRASLEDINNLDSSLFALANKVCPFSDGAKNEDELTVMNFNLAESAYSPMMGSYNALLAGRQIDDTHLLGSSSGGLTSWLIKKLFSLNKIDAVIHVGQSTVHGRLFEYRISYSADESDLHRKSAYYATTLHDVLNVVKHQPSRTYAIVGVPCFIKAARLIVSEQKTLFSSLKYFVGLVCGHMKTSFFAESNAWQLGIKPSDIDYVDFRVKVSHKKSTQYSFGAKSKFDDELRTAEVSKMMGGNWGHAFFQPNACNYCDDIFAETADVMFGDAWLPQFKDDARGTNIVVIRNQEILDIFSDTKFSTEVHLENLTPIEVEKSQSGGIRHRRLGLQARIYDDLMQNKKTLAKRVEAKDFDKEVNRAALLRQRKRMSALSISLFAEAKLNDDYDSFKSKMSDEIKKYKELDAKK